MTTEPITIFSARIDPEGVLACLQAMSSDLRVVRDSAGWSNVTITLKRGFLRRPHTITFTHARDYYTAPDFPNQIRGMQGYFSRFPKGRLMQRALMTISSFRFAISVHPAPEPPLAIDSDDERLEFVHAVAKHLDGAIFTPSGLRDASGRIMIHATLPPHPDAVPPALSIEAPHPSMMPRYWGGTLPNPPSPSPQRVALRTLCLLAASYRAMLEREQDTPERLRAAHVDFLEWVNAVGLKAELEPEELGLLTALIGSGNARRFMNAEWLIEGAAILAWALRKLEWPAYDSQVDVALMGKTCGLSSPEQAREFLKTPVLRDHADIERRTTQLLALHWRLRELRLHPGRKDFQTWSQNAWFGKMPLEGIRFLAGDLAIGTTPISQAPASLLMPLELSIQERHRALNWLCGAHELYSKTDTPT